MLSVRDTKPYHRKRDVGRRIIGNMPARRYVRAREFPDNAHDSEPKVPLRNHFYSIMNAQLAPLFYGERRLFRTTRMGVMLTFSNVEIPYNKFESWCIANGYGFASHVVEHHMNGIKHTHIVAMRMPPITFDLAEIEQAFGHHPNMKSLATQNDIYQSMAYCCKDREIQLWVSQGYSKSSIHEQILGCVWRYANKARGPAQRRLLSQYKRLRLTWMKTQEEGASQDPVCSEDPDAFFQ